MSPPRTSSSSSGSLIDGFARSYERAPDRPALQVEGRTWTFRELGERAASLARALEPCRSDGVEPLTAILAERSLTAFSGVVASLVRGNGYVPLNPGFPAARLRDMLGRSGAGTLVVDVGSLSLLEEILSDSAPPMTIVVPGEADVSALRARLPEHRVLGGADLSPGDSVSPPPTAPDAVAYLLFTSGSTGEPKGVGVTHANARQYVRSLTERYAVTEDDRFSQTFDFSFDLSVSDMFVAWESGARVVCPSRADLLAPAAYIVDNRLTVWFSVPSLGVLMNRTRVLEPRLFPDLRVSLFCGEPLTAELARAWSKAAPGSIVENLYGPTELTIACMRYRWDAKLSPPACENGIVPIGRPYPKMRALVVDAHLREVPPGECGELLMTGTQRTPGYWRDPVTTRKAFVVPPGHDEVFYRTGDRVRRPEHAKAPFKFVGRTDHQIKIRGFRVELGEVECALRDAGVAEAVVLPWPRSAAGAEGLVAFLAGTDLDVAALRKELAGKLPVYEVPRELHLLPELPRNASGKVDRKSLVAMLEGEVPEDAESLRRVTLTPAGNSLPIRRS